MTVRSFGLGYFKAGISRLRERGGAADDSLYNLINGRITASHTIEAREGTRVDYTLPAGTKGLCSFNSKLHVFAGSITASGNAGYVIDVLPHPTIPSQTIKTVHFAKPFLGFLYVVPEFANGDVFHYWLQSGTTWTANTAVTLGTLIAPTTPNGYVYKATRLAAAPPTWTANTTHAVSDIVTPTVANGFDYTATSVNGTNPASGATEPTWPAADGATVNEDTGLAPSTPTTPYDPTVITSTAGTPPTTTTTRYGKPGTFKGSGGGSHI